MIASTPAATAEGTPYSGNPATPDAAAPGQLGATPPVQEDNAVGRATTPNVPDLHDEHVLSSIHVDIRLWNALTEPLVTAFRDPTVTAEAFVQRSQPSLPAMHTLADEISAKSAMLHDADFSRVLLPLGNSYRAEAMDFDLLVTAVARGDQASQTALARRLTGMGHDRIRDVSRIAAYVRQRYGEAYADAFTSYSSG